MSISATAKALSIGWDLVNQLALDACRNLVYGNPHHLDGVAVLGVDEHVWKHTHRSGEPDSFATVLVDLTPVVDGRGSARLIDMVPGRSRQVLRSWLNARDQGFRDRVQVVTMDLVHRVRHRGGRGLAGCGEGMDPFHVVHLAADKLTACRQRLQRETTGCRGRAQDPLYKNRRALLTRTEYLTDIQRKRPDIL